MTKKICFAEKAEILYVIHGKSLKDIGLVFAVSPRTLQKWKQEGEWDLKRAEHLCIEHKSYKEAHSLIVEILRKIAEDERNGIEVPIERYNSLKSLSDTLAKIQKAESAVQTETRKEKKSREQILDEIQKIIMG